MSIVNAWILYKKVTGIAIQLAQFCEKLAIELCQNSIDVRKMKGRTSKESVEQQMQDKLKKRVKRTPTAKIPSEQICKDDNQHWPNFENVIRVCRLPRYKYQSFVMCSKCGLYLCCNKERNCFATYHKY